MTNCIEQDSLTRRRSVYNLGKTHIVPDSCLLETINNCVKNCPTPFNAQTARIAVLLGQSQQDFWDLVWKNMQKVVTEDKAAAAKQKIDSFAAAYGTILYFEDINELEKLQKQFPLYQQNMHDWTMQANGILEYMIWQALAENEIGASLQHYSELVEIDAKAHFKLPEQWKMVAQMPFGSIEKAPADKTFLPLEPRVKVFK